MPQWAWYALQIAVFMATWCAILGATRGENFGHAPTFFAFLAALVVTLMVDGTIRLLARLRRKIAAKIDKTHGVNPSRIVIGREGEAPEGRPRIGVSQEPRKLIDI